MRNKLLYILDYIFCLLIVQPIQFIFMKVYVEEVLNYINIETNKED